MKTMTLTLMVLLAALPLAAGAQGLVKDYHNDNAPQNQGNLDITVWLDHKDGVYSEGENVTAYFRASQDCYVALYSIDTKGNLSMLFPVNPGDDGFVRGGEEYAVPADNADYDLVVTGPEGIESIEAVASGERMNIPDWYNGSSETLDSDTDRDHFVQYINDRYFDCRWDDCPRATTSASIYVKGSHYYYRPVYVPRTWLDYPDYSCIYIDYPFGGEIYIDGIFIGIAPCWIPRIMYGYHWFTIYDHYGYCWEDRIDCYNGRTIYLDHSRIKTTRTFVSRFKDVRVQAAKFNRSNLVLSDQRVKSFRGDNNKGNVLYHGGQQGRDMRARPLPRGTTGSATPDRVTKRGATARPTDQWNSPREPQSKRQGTGGEATTRRDNPRTPSQATPGRESKRSGGEVKQSTPPAKRSPGTTKGTAPTRKPSGDSGRKSKFESWYERPRTEPTTASRGNIYQPRATTGQTMTGRTTAGGGHTAPSTVSRPAPSRSAATAPAPAPRSSTGHNSSGGGRRK